MFPLNAPSGRNGTHGVHLDHQLRVPMPISGEC